MPRQAYRDVRWRLHCYPEATIPQNRWSLSFWDDVYQQWQPRLRFGIQAMDCVMSTMRQHGK